MKRILINATWIILFILNSDKMQADLTAYSRKFCAKRLYEEVLSLRQAWRCISNLKWRRGNDPPLSRLPYPRDWPAIIWPRWRQGL